MIYIVMILSITNAYLIVDKINRDRKMKQLIDDMELIMNHNLLSFISAQTRDKRLKKLAKTVNEFIRKYRELVKVISQLDQERKDLITNISHDIRTPLTSIMGYLEVILDERNKIEVEVEKKYLSIVYEKSKKLSSISSDFFDFSRLEADNQPLPVEKIRLCNLVQDLVIEFFYEFEKKGINLQYVPPKNEIVVLANKLALERIINNLIKNALSYGASGKVIGINIESKDKFAILHIWDKGAGIAEKDLPHIFKRLYQANSSRSNGGSGLGLTICRELVEKQGGTIKVSSIPKKKTQFTFTIPLVASEIGGIKCKVY
ncbi:Alkaline phosphatase synthesis sensor protein PhoR [Bacillus cereus]|nr:Alkaline phosphatase synthesis sensor protein PhoR [Bacillus cereus]